MSRLLSLLAPEPCLSGRCYSPLACNGFGYCRQRNFLASLAPRHVPLALLAIETDQYATQPEQTACWRCPAPLKLED